MAGRPPKPTALKLLQGNPGKRRLNDAEPKPLLGAQPPQYVSTDPALLAEWNRQAARLFRLGLLTEIDDSALAMICVLEVRLLGVLAIEAESGLSALPVILDLSKELRQLWSRFGMTPADRAKVKAEKAPEKSKLARFTNGA